MTWIEAFLSFRYLFNVLEKAVELSTRHALHNISEIKDEKENQEIEIFLIEAKILPNF